jgi:hypothetical protein
MNCFGAALREAGHRRVPAPPQMIRGTRCRDTFMKALVPTSVVFAAIGVPGTQGPERIRLDKAGALG